MKLPRRNFLHLAAGAAAVPALPRFAWAQAYPTRPVRIIVGFPPTQRHMLQKFGMESSIWSSGLPGLEKIPPMTD
jgi:hypothetical protein